MFFVGWFVIPFLGISQPFATLLLIVLALSALAEVGGAPAYDHVAKDESPPAQGRRLAAKERLLRRLHESLYVLFGITAHAASK